MNQATASLSGWRLPYYQSIEGKFVMKLCYLPLILFTASNALAEVGPMQEPLQVVQMYTGDANNRIYIRFNQGAMPGCYADSGGRLYLDDPFYSTIYSQVLVLMTTGGMKGRVVFDNEAGPGWSVCRIRGLDLLPI